MARHTLGGHLGGHCPPLARAYIRPCLSMQWRPGSNMSAGLMPLCYSTGVTDAPVWEIFLLLLFLYFTVISDHPGGRAHAHIYEWARLRGREKCVIQPFTCNYIWSTGMLGSAACLWRLWETSWETYQQFSSHKAGWRQKGGRNARTESVLLPKISFRAGLEWVLEKRLARIGKLLKRVGEMHRSDPLFLLTPILPNFWDNVCKFAPWRPTFVDMLCGGAVRAEKGETEETEEPQSSPLGHHFSQTNLCSLQESRGRR